MHVRRIVWLLALSGLLAMCGHVTIAQIAAHHFMAGGGGLTDPGYPDVLTPLN